MKHRIIADSCCDLTPNMKKDMGIVSIPLTMTFGDKEFCDDECLDMDGYMDEMRSYSGKPSSASPSPHLYQEAIEATNEAFIITLSSKLSGSYNNAVIGNNQAEEETGNGAVFIFDSKTAAAGETLIALKLHEMIRAGVSNEGIVEKVNRFIDGMKTYFVLEKYDNLQKNGRLRKITSSLFHLLNIKLIMGADGNGEIALYEKCKGIKSAIKQFLSLIENSGKETRNENLVITHCNNRKLAEQLAMLIKDRFDFREVFIVPTGGLSSLYVDEKGIVIAF